MTRRWWLKTQAINLGIALLVFGLIQLIPVSHHNPPIQSEPIWDSPQTRDLVQKACYDCHSNTTHWPWYSRIAPVSWVTWYDVTEGRQRMNFSEWDRFIQPETPDEASASIQKPLAERIAHLVESGKMPPRTYRLMNPQARLSDSDKKAIINGLSRTIELSQKGANP